MSTSVIATPWNNYSDIAENFTLTDTASVSFAYNYDKADENANDIRGVQTVYAYAYKKESNGTYTNIASWSNWTCPTQPDPLCGSDAPSNEISTKFLLPGTYRIEVRYLQGYVTTLSAIWNDKTEVVERAGGGLRIKSIINTANGVTNAKKLFIYTDNDKSTGLLLNQPNYLFSTNDVDDVNNCQSIAEYVGRMSSTINSAGLHSSGIIGYSKVTVLEGVNGENGKAEYFYYNSPSLTPDHPFIPQITSSLNGQIAVEAIYKNGSNIPIRKKDYVYSVKKSELVKSVKVYDPHSASSNNSVRTFNVKYYDDNSSWTVLDKETLEENMENGKLTSSIEYFHESSNHYFLTKQVNHTSKGESIITNIKYPTDYSIGTNSDLIAKGIKNLQDKYVISVPVETYIQKTDVNGSNSKTISAVLNTFKIDVPKQDFVYKLKISSPSSSFVPLNISSTAVTKSSDYESKFYNDSYDSYGNLLQQHKSLDINHSYVWDYKSVLPVAEATNAAQSSIAYTSFEADGKGNWTFNSSGISTTAGGITGSKSYALSGTNSITKSGLTSGNYVVSYWLKTGSGTARINGTSATLITSHNGWSLYQRTVINISSITISGAATIDDVRLYPSDAQMTTYTYEPLVGMTSQCDANNRITYYEYDGMGRLARTRDMDNNILKQYSYKYEGQPASVEVPFCEKATALYSNQIAANYTITMTNTANGAVTTLSLPASSVSSLSDPPTIPSGIYNITITPATSPGQTVFFRVGDIVQQDDSFSASNISVECPNTLSIRIATN